MKACRGWWGTQGRRKGRSGTQAEEANAMKKSTRALIGKVVIDALGMDCEIDVGGGRGEEFSSETCAVACQPGLRPINAASSALNTCASGRSSKARGVKSAFRTRRNCSAASRFARAGVPLIGTAENSLRKPPPFVALQPGN